MIGFDDPQKAEEVRLSLLKTQKDDLTDVGVDDKFMEELAASL